MTEILLMKMIKGCAKGLPLVLEAKNIILQAVRRLRRRGDCAEEKKGV